MKSAIEQFLKAVERVLNGESYLIQHQEITPFIAASAKQTIYKALTSLEFATKLLQQDLELDAEHWSGPRHQLPKRLQQSIQIHIQLELTELPTNHIQPYLQSMLTAKGNYGFHSPYHKELTTSYAQKLVHQFLKSITQDQPYIFYQLSTNFLKDLDYLWNLGSDSASCIYQQERLTFLLTNGTD